MKRILLFFFLLSCLISTAANSFTNNYNYSNSQKVAATTVAAIGRFVGLYSQLAELSYESRLADRATSIAQLQTSLEDARRLQREGTTQDGSVLRRTEKQITEYQEECQQLEKSLRRNAGFAAGFSALGEVASLANNMTEKALVGVERLCLAQTLPTELRATRLEERRLFILLDTLLQTGRSFLNSKARNLSVTREGALIQKRKAFMIVTGVQRLLHMIHTWRKWHGFGNMPKFVRLSFLVQIVNFGIGFFLPYRDLKNDIWPAVKGEMNSEDNAIIDSLKATQRCSPLAFSADQICPICQDDDAEDLIQRVSCKHIFHRECHESTLTNFGESCPVCRNEETHTRSEATTRPFISPAMQDRIDARRQEIAGESRSHNMFINNCMLLRLFRPGIFGPSPLDERIADLSRGTSGDPIDPTAVSSTVPNAST